MFDLLSRTILIYRFPTICAVGCMTGGKNSILDMYASENALSLLYVITITYMEIGYFANAIPRQANQPLSLPCIKGRFFSRTVCSSVSTMPPAATSAKSREAKSSPNQSSTISCSTYFTGRARARAPAACPRAFGQSRVRGQEGA